MTKPARPILTVKAAAKPDTPDPKRIAAELRRAPYARYEARAS